jgi:uncharacterized protein (TIGR00296 family)
MGARAPPLGGYKSRPARQAQRFPIRSAPRAVLDENDGTTAVRMARSAVAEAVAPPEARGRADRTRSATLSPLFQSPRGVFVTLSRWPSGELRGCIGYPLPVYPLGVAIPRMAAAAALEDPRFRPVEVGELDALTIEVSVLTLPEPLPGTGAEGRLAHVRVGVDGLIVDRGGSSGLLLPQVAPEQGWNALELLEGTCQKAGLPPDAWRSPATQVRRFQAEVFGESSPNGPVVRRGDGAA